MNPKPISVCALGAAALLGWLAVPSPSNGQADNEAIVLGALLTEVTAQQAAIVANHTKLDEKLALVAEEIRVARIHSGRGGGKAAAK